MKKTLSMALAAAGLFVSVAAIAQVPVGDPNAFPSPDGSVPMDATAAPMAADPAAADYYQQTGWNPGIFLLASSGLAAGSLLLKAKARRA